MPKRRVGKNKCFVLLLLCIVGLVVSAFRWLNAISFIGFQPKIFFGTFRCCPPSRLPRLALDTFSQRTGSKTSRGPTDSWKWHFFNIPRLVLIITCRRRCRTSTHRLCKHTPRGQPCSMQPGKTWHPPQAPHGFRLRDEYLY